MRGENRLARSLDFHVNMACSTRVFSGKNGFKGVASLLICVLVTSQRETTIVVIPVTICMPEVQPGMSGILISCLLALTGRPTEIYPIDIPFSDVLW